MGGRGGGGGTMVSKVGERERETGLVVVAAVEEKEEEVGDAPKFNDVLAWLLGMCLRRPQEERISGVVLIRLTAWVGRGQKTLKGFT